METITQLLNEIEKSLQQLDHSCVVHLNPGISSQQIQELFEKIPFAANSGLACSLYLEKRIKRL